MRFSYVVRLGVFLQLALVLPICAGCKCKPPIPIHIVQGQYTQEALSAHVTGAVFLTAEVDRDGVPRNVRLVHRLGWGLDDNAVEAIRAWRFRPAVCDGTPVRVRVPVEITFRLPSGANPT